jgi:hypothetical protein
MVMTTAQGRCWCGQQWDGQTMCFAAPSPQAAGDVAEAAKDLEGDLAALRAWCSSIQAIALHHAIV